MIRLGSYCFRYEYIYYRILTESEIKLYTPKPIDTSHVKISHQLANLIEKLAENAHNIWAKNRIAEGWTVGSERNDAEKKHPDLIPYNKLSESEKEYDRNTVIETLKALVAFGYKIKKAKGLNIIIKDILSYFKEGFSMSKSTDSLSDHLWNRTFSADNYPKDTKYQDHVLEQYKIYVEMADRISARRNVANTFFLTLHTAIIGSIGFAFGKGFKLIDQNFIIFPLLAVLALCYAWWRLVKSYRQLNTAKYKVIGELEKRLPASPYWSAEWTALGEGKDIKLYVPLTHIENWIPIIFSIIYVLGAASLYFGLIK